MLWVDDDYSGPKLVQEFHFAVAIGEREPLVHEEHSSGSEREGFASRGALLSAERLNRAIEDALTRPKRLSSGSPDDAPIRDPRRDRRRSA